MTINAEQSRNSDLVNRYAARMRSRNSGRFTPVRNGRRTSGIQTFGRRPYTRKRHGPTRSKQAITTLMATALMATAAPSVVAGSATSASSYEIRAGDTLTAIAAHHGLTVDELLQLNNIDDPNEIAAGADLLLGSQESQEPVESQEPEDTDVQVGDTVYEVRSGDTLMGIATAHGVPVEDLVANNDIGDQDVVFAGDFLIIPTGVADETDLEQDEAPIDEEASGEEVPADADETAVPADDDQSHIVSLHLVARGESPGSIAARYGITTEQLLLANDIADEMIVAGEMLRIPDAGWNPQDPATSEVADDEVTEETDVAEDTDVTEYPASEASMLEDMPVQQQALPLSSETAAISMATAYWGHQVSEWVFIENMPEDQNPHRGFRGDMNGEPGGTGDYGVYPKPLSAMLANYGFIGDEFYTMGDPQELKERIDRGQPVLVWMTGNASSQNRLYDWHQGERFALVPHQHVVVAYGYDDDIIHVADPGTGQHVSYSWNEFINSWSAFDGMSMAVYPKG